MNNTLKTSLAFLLTSGVANADTNDIPDLDPSSIVHYCPADQEVTDFGQLISNTREFNGRFKDAVNVEPEELVAARKAKAQETLRLALSDLSPEQIETLAGKIKLLTEVKPGTSTAADLKAEADVLAELKAKLATLSTLVNIDRAGVMTIKEVDVTAKTLERADVQKAFMEFAERGLPCSPDVISWVVAKDSFPTLSDQDGNSAEFDAFVTALHPKTAPTAAVQPAQAAKKPEASLDQNVVFLRNLQTILNQFDTLQKYSQKGITAYTAYMSQDRL